MGRSSSSVGAVRMRGADESVGSADPKGSLKSSLTTESGSCESEDSSRETYSSLEQVTKGARWMPWRREAMKDVASCEKLRGAASRL